MYMFRAGFVAIIGRPNAGKSSLVNRLVGEKVAIISSKPQTTRDNILGILTTDDYQIVFVDTPGIHHSKNHLDKKMMKNVRSAISGVDLIVYLLDTSKKIDDEERAYLQHLPPNTLVVKTKKDLPSKLTGEDCDLEISAKTGENLSTLLEMILQRLPAYESPQYLFEKGYFTDKSIKFLIAEQIREEALNILHEEVPHGIAVEIIRFYEGTNIVEIDADIVCENERHKGMIIGKGGSILKTIGISARKYAEELLGKKVMLKLFVKVEKDWRNKPEKLKNLGY